LDGGYKEALEVLIQVESHFSVLVLGRQCEREAGKEYEDRKIMAFIIVWNFWIGQRASN